MNTTSQPSAIANPPQERLAAGLIAGIFLVVAVAAAGYGLIVLVSAAKEILVAVIAASASLLSAVFAYAFQRAKDIELAAIQRRRELEGAERKVKQENYARILESLAPYIRNPERTGDNFTTAYLYTWITGSVAVVEAVNAFLKNQNSKTLDALLRTMRDDLTLEKWGSDQALKAISSEGLFPVPAPLSGLAAGTNRVLGPGMGGRDA